jgi:hypothetical protein
MRGKYAVSGPTKTVEYNLSDKSLFTRIPRWNVARFLAIRWHISQSTFWQSWLCQQ